MTYVTFKSTPENYKKEKSGIKPNTLRKIEDDDIRFIILRNDFKHVGIEIMNTETFESFRREITDYTEYDGYGIISWKHVNEMKCNCNKCMGL